MMLCAGALARRVVCSSGAFREVVRLGGHSFKVTTKLQNCTRQLLHLQRVSFVAGRRPLGDGAWLRGPFADISRKRISGEDGRLWKNVAFSGAHR